MLSQQKIEYKHTNTPIILLQLHFLLFYSISNLYDDFCCSEEYHLLKKWNNSQTLQKNGDMISIIMPKFERMKYVVVGNARFQQYLEYQCEIGVGHFLNNPQVVVLS